MGDAVRVAFKGGLENAPVSRYFYAITHGGLTYATVGTSPTFRTTFTADVRAVHRGSPGCGSTGTATTWRSPPGGPRLRLADRTLTVQVTPDKTRYAPGDTATVTIRTLGPDGKPVAASVYVQTVDEKLYAMGAAEQVDPLEALYEDLGDGIIAWAASHRTPARRHGRRQGRHDGRRRRGDERGDFRDWLVATMVTTGSDGTARVTVPLSDDLTSWHVSAAAVDAALEAGSGTGFLAVGLPFFAEATIAPRVPRGRPPDHPGPRLRVGPGGGREGHLHRDLGHAADERRHRDRPAFKAAEVPLPALSAGTHRIRIAATVGSGSTLRSDTLVRTFEVVTTRTSRLMTTWAALDGPMAVKAGDGLTRITLVDAGPGPGRAAPAGALLDRQRPRGPRPGGRAGQPGAGRAVRPRGPGRDRRDGARPVPRRERCARDRPLRVREPGGDGPGRHGPGPAPRRGCARRVAGRGSPTDDHNYTREQRLLALAGLAGLGEPVLPDVREAAAQANLTVPEQINVAIAALYAGDEALARSIEQDVLARHGLRLGPWVRIDPGSGADAAVQTARLAIVAASLGDPVAADDGRVGRGEPAEVPRRWTSSGRWRHAGGRSG